ESAASAVPPLPGGGMLAQLTLGLAVVLVLAIGLSWFLRRYALPRGGAIRVIGGLPLGSRERLLLIEVDEARLLLGITPSQIQTLHVFAPVTSRPAETVPFEIASLSQTPESSHVASKS
ncbi:MAG TPA: flagellar biosynthetic protein FliO, partial [Candidatus Competibacter sp.]|nr:flagellar biosynthetic protein FliO [Candidatus Competibacter sp.]